MEETNKLPLKRVEFSLTKFNEVAIPHHLDLLRQHKANIIKYEECGEWARVRTEQTHARRVASQLRTLLAEMDTLRQQVSPQDHARFDVMTQRSRDLTLKSIVDYLGVIEHSCTTLVNAAQRQLKETSPLSMNRRVEDTRQVAGSAISTDSVGVVAHAEPELAQLVVDEHEVAIKEREAVLRGWCELQSEVHALHETWHHMHRAAQAQREQVATVDTSINVAAENVEAARVSLSMSERLRAGAYGAGGAAIGALAGGPVGLLIGAKAGAAALLAGSAIGYWGARLIGAKRQQQIDSAHNNPPTNDDTELKPKTQ